MEPPHDSKGLLPPNAYTPLKEGETYEPLIPADRPVPEITARSVLYGAVMAAVFSFAVAYLGLKAGNVIEAAIPIAILAVFFGRLHRRRNTILENVIIQSIGACSGAVVAGVIFVIPALYILKLEPSVLQTFIVASLGAFIGILFLIPLRRYFCRDEHGKLPFPEATATTEILATGEAAGGSQGKLLLIATGIGGVFDFLSETIKLWKPRLSSDVLLGDSGRWLLDRHRFLVDADGLAALFGLGYIIGIKYAAIIAAGSALSFLVLTPLVFHFGWALDAAVPPGGKVLALMTQAEIFATYVQKIGIGCIAMAGLIGIVKMGKIIVSSFGVGFSQIFRGTCWAASAWPCWPASSPSSPSC
jgi:putative OPT family oligopeptide transporter